MTKTIQLNHLKLGGGNPLFLIAGPCVIEKESFMLETARRIKEIADRHQVPFIFKSSYDKANRSAHSSFRGPGILKGLEILQKIKDELHIPVLSDVHTAEEVEKSAKVLDILQIPAFLCRQTDLLTAAAQTGRIVNIKKGQFLSPWDVKNIIEKMEAMNHDKFMITERGTTFGYNNLVSDMRALPVMRRFGYPVIFDGTHSVQLPGGAGKASSGQREFVAPLVRAAAAAGCDGLFLEVHPDPDHAPSDGPNMITPDDLDALLGQVKRIEGALKI
ncbi:MAG: 3-deoxy-8-phosphooctulonate synthase [Nitrospirae bacterium]|nr:3-deoxy-8-phosphooctulonate synthase [Nitrospirota bacterium]MBI3353040.1 3-deoxy-8-phosphooctulonate synthase [Nitrospirota bacterium]